MAGAVLVVSALVTTASLGVTGVAAATALAESQRLAGVADAAALAGGDAMLGWVSEQPCDAATRVARANGAPLTACSIEGATVAKPEVQETGWACPNCGKPLAQRKGRFGPFLGCTGYPECKTIVNLDKEGNPRQELKQVEGAGEAVAVEPSEGEPVAAEAAA